MDSVSIIRYVKTFLISKKDILICLESFSNWYNGFLQYRIIFISKLITTTNFELNLKLFINEWMKIDVLVLNWYSNFHFKNQYSSEKLIIKAFIPFMS